VLFSSVVGFLSLYALQRLQWYLYLRVFIRGLRQKLEPDPTRPIHILTELGVGYRLQLPSEQRI
jgi:hypothetical protein